MRRSLALLFALALSAAAPLGAQERPACVRVEAVVRWGADAYNHFVRIDNGCPRPVRCQVSTNVNPSSQTVDVGPGASTEVITFRGSPASEFTPRVTCELR